MIILNWLVLGPFGLQGSSLARDAIISSAVTNDLIGEATITPTPGMVTAGKTWQVLSQPYPDLLINQGGVNNGFLYNEANGNYVPGGAWSNNLTGTFKVTSFSDSDVRLAYSTGAQYVGSVVDAIHIHGNAPVSWDAYELIDMTKYMTPIDRAVYYAFVNFYSPTSQSARLLIRSDDDSKVWLNHTKVYGTDTIAGFSGRGVGPTVDKTNVTINAGWNTLLIKVVNSGGPTGFAVCIADTMDAPLTNLVYSTDAINTSVASATETAPYTTTQDAELVAFLNAQPASSLGSTWQQGMTPSEYLATLSPQDRATVEQAMYAGNASLPAAPKSGVLASATDSLVAKGWGITPQMLFYAAIGIAVILIAILIL